MKTSDEKGESSPGSVISVTKESMKVACGNNGFVEIFSILPQGKKEMSPYTYSLGNNFENRLK